MEGSGGRLNSNDGNMRAMGGQQQQQQQQRGPGMHTHVMFFIITFKGCKNAYVN